MSDDERLRETLLEVQFLRQREAQTLVATRALLECLEVYSAATDPEAALSSIFTSIAAKTGADLTLLAVSSDTGTTIASASRPELVGSSLGSPIDLSQRSRNISDLATIRPWDAEIDLTAYDSLAVCPGPSGASLLAFRGRGERFAKSDLALLERLAGLVTQATRNAQTAKEKTLLSAALAGSSSGIAIADAQTPDLPLVYVNPAFEKISGYDASEVIGQNCRFLSAEAPDAPERVRLRQAVTDRASGTFLLRNKRKSGDLFWNELSLFPVYDRNGQVRNLVATQSDVTSRIEAANDRDQARARMDKAFRATEDAILVLESDDTVALSNDAVQRLFPAPNVGWHDATTFADNWSDYIGGMVDFPGRVTQLLALADLDRLAQAPKGQELDLPDGRSVLVRCANLDDGGKVLFATDISSQKSAQRLLAQRLAAIEAAPDGIAITDDDGRLIYLNSAGKMLMGFPEATSGLGRIWRQQYRNEDSLGDLAPFESGLAEKDGATHEVTSSPLATGGHILLVRDVTEKLATERREEELTRDLIRLQRQEAIAQVTAGVAHDFNNFLAAINGSATLIDMNPALDDDTRKHLRRISTAGAQAAKLVNRLLDIGAGEDMMGSFELTSALLDLRKLVRPLLPEGATFNAEPADGPVVLRGDRVALSQILINLVLNAAEALKDGQGEISVTAHTVTGAPPSPPTIGSLATGQSYAAIDVSDTGTGMTPETLAQVFQPYFSTKGKQGTGLGMAMVAAQIKLLGGAIDLNSTLDVGTNVRLYWPLLEQDIDQPKSTLDRVQDLAGFTVLVVDDDAQVGEVTSRFLETRGAEVAQCERPEDALEAITEDPGAWSAIITDYDMPTMSGGELVERISLVDPDLPVLVVTALARRLRDPRLVKPQVAGILSKPADLEALCTSLAGIARPGTKDE